MLIIAASPASPHHDLEQPLRLHAAAGALLGPWHVFGEMIPRAARCHRNASLAASRGQYRHLFIEPANCKIMARDYWRQHRLPYFDARFRIIHCIFRIGAILSLRCVAFGFSEPAQSADLLHRDQRLCVTVR